MESEKADRIVELVERTLLKHCPSLSAAENNKQWTHVAAFLLEFVDAGSYPERPEGSDIAPIKLITVAYGTKCVGFKEIDKGGKIEISF